MTPHDPKADEGSDAGLAESALLRALAVGGQGGPRRPRRWTWVIRAMAIGIAAGVVIAVAGLLLFRDRPVRVDYAELARAIQASGSAPWMHFVESGGREHWVSFRPYRSFTRSGQGIRAADRAANRQFEYEPLRKSLTIRLMGLPSGRDMEAFASVAAFWQRRLGDFDESGAEVMRETGRVDGRAATLYTVTRKDWPARARVRFFADPATGRVIGGEGAAPGVPGPRVIVDYPESGPADVYTLGVPRDAVVIDRRPPPDAMRIVTAVEAAAKAQPRTFYQVSCEIIEKFASENPPENAISVEVFRGKDGRFRRDFYRIPWPRPADAEAAAEYLKNLRTLVPIGSLKGLETWLEPRKPYRIAFADGETGAVVVFSLEGARLRRRDENHPFVAALPRRPCYPLMALDDVTQVLRGVPGAWGPLVGIENRTPPSLATRWLFNPARDYICERIEWRQGAAESAPATSFAEVLEYRKTPGGAWFPTRMRRVAYGGREETLVVTYRDDRRPIDDPTLDPVRVTADTLSADETQSAK